MCLTFPRWDEPTTGPEKNRAKEGLTIAQGEGVYPSDMSGDIFGEMRPSGSDLKHKHRQAHTHTQTV